VFQDLLPEARVVITFMHIIIDGYNLIRQVPSLVRKEQVSLEAGREELINLLAQYKKIKRHKITVVFDGVLNLSEFSPAYQQAGIHIRFSPEGKNADRVICDLLEKERDVALAVSSDNSVIQGAEKHACGVIKSPAFYDKVYMAVAFYTMGEKDDVISHKPAHKRWMTKKKGPTKKLPKRERKNKKKTDKL